MIKVTISKVSVIIITFVLIVILLSQITIHDIIATLTGMKPLYLIVGFLLYLSSYVFRSLRFHILLNKEIGIKDLFHIICVHNMANNILPARTGELSYVYLLNKIHNKTTEEGIASLMVARVFDLITIFLIFFIAVYQIRDMSTEIMNISWIIISSQSVLIILLISLLYFDTLLLTLLQKLLVILNLSEINIVVQVLNKIEYVVESIEKIKSFKKFIIVQLFLSSIGIWLSLYIFNYILITAMNIDFNFCLAIFATSFAIFTTVLPIQGIGGFGTLEGGWVLGFIIAGLTKDIAISSGFSYHIIIWIYFLILGCWGVFVMQWNKSQCSPIKV